MIHIARFLFGAVILYFAYAIPNAIAVLTGYSLLDVGVFILLSIAAVLLSYAFGIIALEWMDEYKKKRH